jgi:type II secretory pathway pseudopilin PulG
MKICAKLHANQLGYALLGLMMALAVMAIMLLSIIPNVQMSVRRDKEAELIYRGQLMAEAIARYYNRGALYSGYIQLRVPPPYGYLYDLKKLRDGVTIGVKQMKFVRPSALIDPLSNQEWEPVRARDPRIMPALQAYAAEKNIPIPPSYMELAAAPVKTHFAQESSTSKKKSESGQGSGVSKPPNKSADSDEDDETDEEEIDPLAHLFQSGSDRVPIVGVAPRIKGPAIRTLWGLKSYEEWVFIYIPDPTLQNLPPVRQPGKLEKHQ